MEKLDVPAELTGGRTFIPLRFVSESLGAYVDYSPKDQEIDVSYTDMSGWKDYTAPLSELKYKYPADWTVKTVNEDTAVNFTSPLGSELWVYWTDETPEQVRARLKQQAVTDGFTFSSEDLDDPKDPDQGFQLEYSLYDVKTDTQYRYIVYTNPMDTGSFVQEQLIKDDENFSMDNEVMLAIAQS